MNSETNVKILVSRQEIAAVVKKLASDISRDYHDNNPLLVGILKGSFIFLSDLARQLDFPLEIDFVSISSYGRGRTSPGELKLLHRLKSPIKDRHVIVVEDIVDTGHSLKYLMDYLGSRKPASLKLCVFADKPSRRRVSVAIDYKGVTVPDKFIVGYGMDWNEKYRNLPDLSYIESKE